MKFAAVSTALLAGSATAFAPSQPASPRGKRGSEIVRIRYLETQSFLTQFALRFQSLRCKPLRREVNF